MISLQTSKLTVLAVWWLAVGLATATNDTMPVIAEDVDPTDSSTPLITSDGAQEDALQKRIAIVPKMRAAEAFYGLTRQGCQDRVALENPHNISCFYTGSMEPNVTGNVEILYELVDDDSVVGISVSVLDPDAYAPVIDAAMAKGKPVITFDSDAPDTTRVAYVGTDNYAMGNELAKLLKQIKPDGGTYGIVSGFGDNLMWREAGVRELLAETDWVEVMNSPKNGLEDTAISLEKMWELVEEYPDLDAVVSVVGLPMFNPNTTDWKHFVDSNRDVLTIIADTLPIQLELMQTSYVDALVGQLPYNMGYQSAEALLKIYDAITDENTPLNETLASDTISITHQLEVLRIPLVLPPLDFDRHYLGYVAIVGYILCALVMGSSLGLMAWTFYHRKHQVVTSSQPIFLGLIALGTLLMGSAIIPLSMDDEHGKQPADIACMCSPWLTFTGFTISFSALFSKTWRLNKIFLADNPLRRIKVTEKDVILPFVVLITLNIITLICWTAISPLNYHRVKDEGTDPWNRSLGSYGQCRSDNPGASVPFLVILAVVNVAALVMANFQSYRARNVTTEFSESTYIGMANASFLQAILICLPIIFLVRDSPIAYFIVLSVVIFILSGAILGCMFVPKIIALKNYKGRASSVRISGFSNMAMSDSTGGSRNRYGSTNSADDPVAALLQDFQRLSWKDKATAMKKLGAAHGGVTVAEAKSASLQASGFFKVDDEKKSTDKKKKSKELTDRTSDTTANMEAVAEEAIRQLEEGGGEEKQTEEGVEGLEGVDGSNRMFK